MNTETQRVIESSMERDDGDAFRSFLQEAINSCGDAYRPAGSPHRTHLGASLIGRKCARQLYYTFRWFSSKKHTGRIQRLFNRGHLEEGRFIAMLRSIGAVVYYEDDNGNQFRISDCHGHYGGSLDSVAVNIPDFPDGRPVLAEYKTHGDKSFKKLKKEGLKNSKFEHYVQMQSYMRKYDLSHGLYMAINKNDDELYTEIVVLDYSVGERYTERAEKIIFADSPPPKISDSKAYFECKFCDYYDVCHNDFEPEVNCRTCQYSRPIENGEWYCSLHQTVIPKDFQYHGCQSHVFIKG